MSEAIGAFGRMIHKTHTSMLTERVHGVAEEIQERFGLRDGDYIEFDKEFGDRVITTTGRMIAAEACYPNQGGGYTGIIKIMPLLLDGRVGNSRSLTICTNSSGTGLRGPGKRKVRKISQDE